MAPTAQHRLVMHLEGEIASSIDDALWNDYSVSISPFGFKVEDPTLTGGYEDGDDSDGVILVNAEGQRFHVDVQVFVSDLPPLEQDPDYIAAQEAKTANEPPPVDSDQLELL